MVTRDEILGCVLKTEPIGFAAELNVVHEKIMIPSIWG